MDFSGVAAVRVEGVSQGSGALLWTGRHIITAAHVVKDVTRLGQLIISFNSDAKIGVIEVASITVHPGWRNNSENFNDDIAIIELQAPLDEAIARYDLYRGFDEVNQQFSRVGYSTRVDPATGEIMGSEKEFHSGSNRYDTTTDFVNPLLGTSVLENYQLSYDFDNGSSANDAWGAIAGLNDRGTGEDEVFARPGDSGGPALIGDRIAGIASYIFRYEQGNVDPDITDAVDASYGELASDTRVSKYANWIDSVVEEEFVAPEPESTDAVDLFPVEGDSGTTVNYFLLTIGAPLSTDASVFYETVDGTAKAGTDYVAGSGRAVIPAGEIKVAIPVEIIGDTVEEEEENFYLRVLDPEGAGFPPGGTELKVAHNIVDNDDNDIVDQTDAIEIVGTSAIAENTFVG